MIILIISATSVGVILCEKSKKKVVICKELMSFCDILLLDLDYKITPAKDLVDKALSSGKMPHIDFISAKNLSDKKQVDSILSKSENFEISQFMFSLGKTDVNTQKKLISGFKEYINNSLNYYCGFKHFACSVWKRGPGNADNACRSYSGFDDDCSENQRAFQLSKKSF